MRTQYNNKKVDGIFKSISVVLMIFLVADALQAANEVEWERMVGDESPGVLIFNERPLCSFSIYKYSAIHYIESPSSLSVSNTIYDEHGRVTEYYASGHGNDHPIETHVYGGTFNELGQLTAFQEIRYYPESGNAYYISISNAKYDTQGSVMAGYDVTINTNTEPSEQPIKPEKAANPRPDDSATNQAITVKLNWSGDDNTTSYDVYFGTDSTPDYGEFKGNQTQNVYYPGTLLYGTTYFWQIDAVNDWQITEGNVWSFTTIELPEKKTIFVDDDASGNNDGTSWKNAYNYLQDALADAAFADKVIEIHVAQGIYRPDQGNGQILDDREATFQLINGVVIKGGYAGLGQKYPNSRDIEIYESILSGELLTGNSYHVVTGNGTDKRAVLDGITISDGNANADSGPLSYGGGMYNDSGSPTLANCSFIGNFAVEKGGGMYNEQGNPTMTNCTFSDNSANRDGGGMYNNFYSSPLLTNCTFSRNSAEREGGGMKNDFYSSPILTNCIINGNSAKREGGGMYNHWHSSPTFTNCIFNANSATSDGGGTYNSWDSNIIMTNCTLIMNSIDAIYNSPDSCAMLTNCILWNNALPQITGDVIISYSNVQSGWPGEGNIDADPLFVDSIGNDNIIGTLDDDLRLLEDSPCIDGGDNSAVPPSLATDIEGNPRIFDSIVDMGAYEYCNFLVAHWSMDDNTDNTMVADSSGNSNNGTAQQNTSVLHVEGPIDGALSFNGINDFINLGSPVLLNDLPTGDFSVSIWINDRSSSGKNLIMGVYPGGGTGWVLRKKSGGSGGYLDFWAAHSETCANYATPEGSILFDSWHHIVAVWDADTKTVRIYIDGTESLYANNVPGQGSYNNDASYDKEIGRMAYTGGIQYFEGNMDQIKIFNKTLSQQEIDELFREG